MFMSIFYLIGLMFLILYRFRNYLYNVYVSLRIPGEITLPILGNAWVFINKTPSENFKVLGDLIQKYGNITRIWIGVDLNVILSNPDDIEIIMNNTKYIEKSDEYRFIKPWLNDGLLLSSGQKWFQRRKIITPAFHFKILENFIDIFERQGDILIKNLLKHNQENKINLYHTATLYTLDVICETAMGIRINAQLNSESAYVKAVKDIAHNLQSRMYHFLWRSDIFFKWSQLGKRNAKSIEILHKFSENVIAERRIELEKMKKNETIKNTDRQDDDLGIKKKKAFLDILLESIGTDGKPLTNIDIREEVDTFMFEGHDTTTSGISFCLYNLAKYPDVQQKCFMELQQIFGNDKNTTATLQDLNNLNYMDLVIRESLRLYPSVPIIGRKLRKPININGYLIPGDTNIIIPIYNMGRDPAIFKNPTEFIPERFNVEFSADKFNPYGYIPFSAGPRNCIGQKFAMYEMKSIVTKILRNFEISLPVDGQMEEPILTAELILKPSNGLNFMIRPRNY